MKLHTSETPQSYVILHTGLVISSETAIIVAKQISPRKISGKRRCLSICHAQKSYISQNNRITDYFCCLDFHFINHRSSGLATFKSEADKEDIWKFYCMTGQDIFPLYVRYISFCNLQHIEDRISIFK